MGTLKQRLPLFTTLTLISGFIFSFGFGLVNYIKLLYYAFEPPSYPIEITYIPLILMFFSLLLGEFSFRFYSRIPALHVKNGNLLILITSHIAVDIQFLWFATAPIHAKVIPYLTDKSKHINFGEYEAIGQVLTGNFHTLILIFVFLPTVFMILFTLWYSGHIVRYRGEILKWAQKYEYKNHKLQKWFNSQEEQIYPDVEIGPHIEHKEMVRIKGKDRTLNGIIIGPIGSGKTSSLIIPMINQDLHWMVRFINKFETAYKKNDYDTEEVKGTYLNGVTVIEPSNDLCQKVFKLVQAHKIPASSVYYIDPTNPDTKNINILRGPVDKVAEVFAMVIQGLSESNNAFFEQAQRNHLKQHIYLLKLHNPQKDVTFDDLIEMYDDVERVHRMHKLLKVQVEKLYDFVQSGDASRDQKNEYKIIKGIDEWFDNTIREKTGFQGEPAVYKSGKYRGQPMHYDREEEYVKGLRNILKDLASNVLIRRVLFGTSDFDFDVHLEQGGILLVNTAKGELADLSNVLGKFILLSMQNAVFRRAPNISPYHHIIVDEFPDYVVRPFKEFPAQSRKYKVILTIASQTLSQLALDFTEQYMFTLLGSFRNKMIFGDVTPYDAKIFSDMFGEKEEFKEAESEQGISPMQENPVSRLGSTYQKTKEVIMSPGDIMAQGAFICAARIVQDNHVQPVQQITSNFVPKEEFIQAVIQVDMEIGRYWENERLRLINESIVKANPMQHVDAEKMKEFVPLFPMQDEEMEKDIPIKLQGEQQYIVSLENYRGHKSESTISSNDSAVVSEQIEVDKEEAENKLYKEIKEFVIESQQVSPAFLQRKFKISYMKAARFIEKLEQNQVVSSYAGNGPRTVLISNDNSIPILPRESDINTTQLLDKSIENTNSQKVAISGEDNEVTQGETSFFKDILYDDVLTFVKKAGTTSISLLQDNFKITYTRASRLIDALQRNGELPALEEISIESVSPEITNTVQEEHIEEVISVELPHIEECPETNMEVEEMNKELSITTLEQEWNKDSIIYSEISDETATFPEESPENGLSISITGDAKTNIESTPILKEKKENVAISTIPVTKTVNHIEENKLEEEVAKVYKSISLTVHQNLKKNMIGTIRNNEEQREYKSMSYKEQQNRLKSQQKNKYNNTQSQLNKNEQPKTNISNVMSKSLDDIFGNIEN
ncbi:DNA translocase FtsK (plasmid) [Bacillus albus]|uniref:DNA translocase FtsK n=1 Tax=Bacillus cereus group TaxID=86661 RepID=UPI0022E6D68F|nr:MULTISPECIES: DNA translocase FtsK [Bacillus cereus group]MDA2029532.1 TraM recognition domain-containing protein [Bacillus cereus group sp. Bcc03]MDA2219114.1 TraM recognition domain-containing protein [Bacillus cereus group sp. Bc228]MDA2230733.1 TraM recognition domain-containing protein [Bacillus cereus group sp. Bc227]MDA2263422.1 TraM recognition domain-containing protein [Bacillus cereus group sp. Bc200]MDA2716234.1 TraM recognition domain-containing protein [Bacillus cereus group sp